MRFPKADSFWNSNTILTHINVGNILNKNKPSLLLIGPRFQNLCAEIKKSLEEDFGFEVTFIDEVLDNFLIRVFIRLKLHYIVSPFIKAYERNIWKGTLGNRFDVVLVINPECLSKEFYARIFERHEESTRIMYLWDAFATNPQRKCYLDVFKENYTFDRHDAKRYGMKYLPLFFSKSFMEGVARAFDNRKEPLGRSKRICFIGTAKSDRIRFLSRIKKSLPSGYTLDLHIFIPHRFLYLLNLLKNLPSYVSLHQLPTLKQMSQFEVGYRFANAEIVLDIQVTTQTGLSIRCIETFAARSFLCTTNALISSEPILGEKKYFGVIDRKKPLGQQITESYENADPIYDCINSFSVKAWLGSLLDN